MVPKILNLILTNADTEYSVDLPKGTQYFSVQSRDDKVIRMAFEGGKVAGSTAPFITVKEGAGYNAPERRDFYTTARLYFASPEAGAVVEILAWV